jgi:hypothetical protein
MSETLMLAHNASQVVVWMAVLAAIPFLDFDKAYDNEQWRFWMTLAQTMQCFDIVFSGLKWVRNNIV